MKKLTKLEHNILMAALAVAEANPDKLLKDGIYDILTDGLSDEEIDYVTNGFDIGEFVMELNDDVYVGSDIYQPICFNPDEDPTYGPLCLNPEDAESFARQVWPYAFKEPKDDEYDRSFEARRRSVEEVDVTPMLAYEFYLIENYNGSELTRIENTNWYYKEVKVLTPPNEFSGFHVYRKYTGRLYQRDAELFAAIYNWPDIAAERLFYMLQQTDVPKLEASVQRLKQLYKEQADIRTSDLYAEDRIAFNMRWYGINQAVRETAIQYFDGRVYKVQAAKT